MSAAKPSAMPSSRSERSLQSLADNLGNAKLARSFVAGMSYAQFYKDRRTFYAVTRCLEIVSEASRRLDAAIRDRHRDLPWRAIAGAGNVYRHNYDIVAEDLIWRTVNDEIPKLIDFAERELSAAGGIE